MSIRYSSGNAKLYMKDIDKPIADIQYSLMSTGSSRYTAMKWWGDFTTRKDLKQLGDHVIEFEDGQRGIVYVYSTSPPGTKTARFSYGFNGRGSLGNRKGGRAHNDSPVL